MNLDIDGWLRGIGLAQYAEMFRANDIDVSVLRHLTDVDLEKLGVSLGHRRKILAAIAELAGAVPVSPQPALHAAKPQDTAERRQVTVMFCDLVGSTALSARMDPEDLRELISAYQKCVAATVRRFGGFVAKYMGDGVLIYFGYPQAHEDDAERAVRAGLELIAAVTALKAPEPLQTRVGIATGLVVGGDLIGSGGHKSVASPARRRTLRRACKPWPSRTPSSSPTARDGFSAISSSWRTSGPRTSRVSPGRCGPGRHSGRVWRKAVSRPCTRPA